MSEKRRYFIELAYNGGRFHGWQIQPNAVTVQEVLEKALSTIMREKTETTGCGRTDTGVHATLFFAHFDSSSVLPLTPSFLTGINAVLPADIAIRRVLPVAYNAHARFDAVSRSYEYHIHHRKDPFLNGFSWFFPYELDIAAMNKAAAIIPGYTDFSCFSKSNTQVFTNNCKVTTSLWRATDHGMVFHITADRFLRNMVRAIVGTLIAVGKGTIKADDVHAVIQSKNRSQAGASVPACGLYLTDIKYPYVQMTDLTTEI